MRQPTQPRTKAFRAAAECWEQIRARDSRVEGVEADDRLRAPRFQNGYMLGIYWETCGRWALMRARRDAAALRTPLYLIQAADRAQPPMPRADAAKLMNHDNPHET